MKKNIRGFTLIEAIVVISILSILSGIAFSSYSSSTIDARDSRRISDMESLKISLKSHKQKEGNYPMPTSPFSLTNSWVVAYQGVLADTILSNVIKNIPKDPKSENWYSYSINSNRQQFQIALTKENQGTLLAVVSGDYKSVAKNLFPTLLVAHTGSTPIDMSWSTTNPNRNRFILNGGRYNLPYDMKGSMVSEGVSFTGILNEGGVIIETGGSYSSCTEIYEAGVSMGSGTYQIVGSTGALVDTWCTMD